MGYEESPKYHTVQQTTSTTNTRRLEALITQHPKLKIKRNNVEIKREQPILQIAEQTTRRSKAFHKTLLMYNNIRLSVSCTFFRFLLLQVHSLTITDNRSIRKLVIRLIVPRDENILSWVNEP